MNKAWIGTIVALALVSLSVVACAQQPESQPADDAVVRIGDEVMTAADVEAMVGPSLVKLRQEIYNTTVAQLNQQIFERLVTEKATAAGQTRDQWINQQLAPKRTEPEESEITKIMTMYRQRLAQDDAQARQQVVTALKNQREALLMDELRGQLFVEANVQILLEPPRVAVSIPAGTPSRGPSSAPVVMVEYTDYQCPYCARIQPTIQTLLDRYDGKIRHVFKNLPLPMHQQAELAGEAALCAQDQDQYWGFHDWLFQNQRTMNRDGMIAAAGELGMDSDLFTACIDGGTHKAAVQADMKEARGFGITGTPGFMINGRVLTGAQPLEAFEKIIDEELALKGIEIPPKPQAAAANSGETATQ